MAYSQMPIDLGNVRAEDLDRELLRVSIWVELDTINLYEQFAARTQDEGIKKVLADVITEEKTHTGQFMEMLAHLDPEQAAQFAQARSEVKEQTGLDVPKL